MLTIALIGVPNCGKSTLLNQILGENLAPVHRKPQMTRKNLLGIHTQGDVQLVFTDCPGIHASTKLLNKRLKSAWESAVKEADVVCILLEIQRDVPPEIKSYVSTIQACKKICVVLNKVDLPADKWVLSKASLESQTSVSVFAVSALTGVGVKEWLAYLRSQAKEQAFLYPEDQLTTTYYRDLACDLIRKAIMENAHQEIPYEATVVVERYKEGPKIVDIDATIIVNKASQKPMLIGKGGDMIKKIRKTAEYQIAQLTHQKIKLHLFVKVDEGWVENAQKIEGYWGV